MTLVSMSYLFYAEQARIKKRAKLPKTLTYSAIKLVEGLKFGLKATGINMMLIRSRSPIHRFLDDKKILLADI